MDRTDEGDLYVRSIIVILNIPHDYDLCRIVVVKNQKSP